MQFYTTEQIGPKRFKTPEGFLLCMDVPLARTGKQIYGPGDENPIAPGPDGLIHIERTAEEVFRPATIASANGKDVVNDHPVEDVMPHNYRDLTCGVCINPRRGEGDLSDCFVGDLLVKWPELIADIDAGKVEISLGYDASYVKTGPGEGYQTGIIINHIAIVARGRCGYRCSIGDRETIVKPVIDSPPSTECGCKSKETDVAKKTIGERIRDALKGKVKDEEMTSAVDAIEGAMKGKDAEETPAGGDIHLHMGSGGGSDGNFCTKDEFTSEKEANAADHQKIRDEMSAMEKRLMEASAKKDEGKGEGAAEEANKEVADELEEEAPKEAKKGEPAKARDSAYLEESFSDTLAGAEILVPGIQPPMTYDRAAKPADTYKNGICALRRKTLDAFYATTEGRTFIDEQLRGRPFSIRDEAAMPCRRVTDMFRAAVSMKKALNNGQVGDLTISAQANAGAETFGVRETISATALAEQAAAAWK